MLSRIWVNALPDSGTSVIHSHTTCTFYFGAITKSSSRRINMFAKLPATPANAFIRLSNSFQKHANACYSRSRFQHYNNMLGTAGPNLGIAQVGPNCFPRSAPLSLQGIVSQPACGVVKWFANDCLWFSSSHVAGSKFKRSSRSAFNFIGGDKKPSAVDTSKLSKMKFKQKDRFEAKVKHSPVNDGIDIPGTNMVMNGGFSKHATEEVATASSKQASRTDRLKNNICEKSKKNKLKTEETNGKSSQASVMEVTVCDKRQASSSSRSMVDEGVRPKKKKSDKKASSKQSHVASRGSLTKVTVDKPHVISSTRANDIEYDQPKKKNLKKQKTAEKASSKQSQIAATDVCDELLIRSSPQSKVVKDSSMEVTHKKASAKQSRVMATDASMEVPACDRTQAKSIPESKLVKSDQSKNKTLKKQKADEKGSSKNSCVTVSSIEVVSHKTQPNSSLRKKLIKGDRLKKKDLKMQKSVEKVSANQSQIATRDNLMKLAVSDKMQTKCGSRSKIVKDDQPKKNIRKTSKASAKKSQLEAEKMSKRGSIEVSENVKERSAPFANAGRKDTSGLKPCKEDKELLINIKYSSGNENELNKKQKKITATHVQGKVVVVVESETKAKTINKYLGGKFVVLASYGHIRDLARRAGSVRPNEGFSMVWEVPSSAWVHIKRIEGALTGARSLILASDPDREGEAIAWHVFEMLKQQRSLNKSIVVQRVVFHEITESAIQKAMESPRDISMNLVNAYHARRALDYLIGFSISPLLWRKLPGCQSAGRVQSAALSLICDREKEIEVFVPQEYWSVEAKASNHELPLSGKFCAVVAKVIRVDGKKLERLSITSDAEAEHVVQKILASEFKVVDLKRSIRQKNPPLPYITSSLQKDAFNKLNFSADYTMKLAQRLYEGVKISDNEVSGLITYMRTDGLRVSEEAAENIRLLVTECYGEAYAVKGVRIFKGKVKNAQEAHEAIRPTDIRRCPSMLANVLEKDLLKLYTLIWCQTMACQMKEAKFTQMSASFANEEKSVILGSSGSAMSFPGYLAVFQDNETLLSKGEEMKQSEENDSLEVQEMEEDGNFLFLTELKIGDPIYMNEVRPLQHATQPQPRYSEGSLISKLEELGIGRPSTYAPIIKTLQAREYVTCRNRRIFPEFRGRMVSAFLSHYFSEIIDYGFTASMESQLDKVSTGSADWKNILSKFWESFHPVCERVSKVGTDAVGNMLMETFRDFLFGAFPEGNETCPGCNKGKLIFKVSRHGAGYFIGCNEYPKCSYISKTLFSEEDRENTDEDKTPPTEPKLLGTDPDSNQQVFLKQGPYGYYVQLGGDVKGWKPKRARVSKIKEPDTIKLEDALELLRYPVVLGKHPEEKKPVELFRAKYGFAVRCRHIIATVPKDVHPQAVTLTMAVQYLKGKKVRLIGQPGHKKQKMVKGSS